MKNYTIACKYVNMLMKRKLINPKDVMKLLKSGI